MGVETGLREFESGGFRTEVMPSDSWIQIAGRGRSLMMSIDEVDDVIAVLNCARDYIKDIENGDLMTVIDITEAAVDLALSYRRDLSRRNRMYKYPRDERKIRLGIEAALQIIKDQRDKEDV